MSEARYNYGSGTERKKHVVRPYEEVPMTELVKGSNSHLVSVKNATISFLTMKANSFFEVHTHENEQIMVVIEGYCDEIIDGKLYRVEKGDVIYLPSNIPHGAFIREVDCKAIDIFVPRREDYMEKYRLQNPDNEVRYI